MTITTTKVKNTVSRLTSTGTKLVTLGILKLMKVDHAIAQAVEGTRREPMDSDSWPIVFSELERIEEGDWVYNTMQNKIAPCTWANDYNVDVSIRGTNFSWVKSDCRKVLVLPRHFSYKQLQSIASRKVNEDSKVWIVCEHLAKNGFYRAGGGPMTDDVVVELNADGHITMHKYADNVTIVMPLSVCHNAQLITTNLGGVKEHVCTECNRKCEVKSQTFVSKSENMFSYDEMQTIACEFAFRKMPGYDAFKAKPGLRADFDKFMADRLAKKK